MATPGPNLPDLRVGARGPAVLAVHRQLAQDGFYSSSIDGNFGPPTERAVRAFQRSRNIPEDGVVGPRPGPRWVRRPRPAPPSLRRAGPWRDPGHARGAQPSPRNQRAGRPGGEVRATGSPRLRPGSAARGSPRPVRFAAALGRPWRRQGQRLRGRRGSAEDAPHYADGRARPSALASRPQPVQRLQFTGMVARVRPLFDPTRLAELTTRTVVWGLALLDRQLMARLERDGFLEAFRAHRTEEILSAEGRALLERADALALDGRHLRRLDLAGRPRVRAVRRRDRHIHRGQPDAGSAHDRDQAIPRAAARRR